MDLTPQQDDAGTQDVGVFVIDDHAGFRALVAEVVAATPGFASVGDAGSWAVAERALELGPRPPQLVLMDVNLGDESGVNAAVELSARWPDIKVILISTLDCDDLPEHARQCGASAFVSKSLLSPGELVRSWNGEHDWPS